MCQNEEGFQSTKNLESLIDRFNSWISNVDQKAGILTSLLGILLTILFTSSFITFFKESIVLPFFDYLHNLEDYSFSIGHTLFFLAGLATIVFGFVSIFWALSALKATINTDEFKSKEENDGTRETDETKNTEALVTKSRVFFGTISKMEYNSFVSVKDNYDYKNDLLSQVYINAKICNRKFERYNSALKHFRFFLISLCVLFVSFFMI